MMTKLIATAVLALGLAAPAMAADANGGTLRGRVLQVRNHIASGGIFRVVEATSYHDGFGLLAESVTKLADTGCTATP